MTSPSAPGAHPRRRVAIAGLGAVGLKIASVLDQGVPGCELVAVSANDRDKARERLAHLSRPVPVVAIEELEALARADEKIVRSLAGREIVRAVVRAPKVVSFTTA